MSGLRKNSSHLKFRYLSICKVQSQSSAQVTAISTCFVGSILELYRTSASQSMSRCIANLRILLRLMMPT